MPDPTSGRKIRIPGSGAPVETMHFHGSGRILKLFAIVVGCLSAATMAQDGVPSSGTLGRYAVLSGKTRTPPPVATVDLLVAPADPARGFWWMLEARATADPASEPLFRVQALTSRHPLARSRQPLRFHRYILQIPETGEVLEYRNTHTGEAMLPPWRHVRRYFFPRPARVSGFREGLAETCTWMGHVLTLQEVKTGAAWKPLEEVKVLELDPELLIGTSRSFKDKEGHRLPQTPEPRNYTYVPFEETDYRVMIEAGINLFTLAPEQEEYVRSEPVFYLRSPAGKPPMRVPADLYRSNYLGSRMFIDEPAVLMVEEAENVKYRRRPGDAATVLPMRVRQAWRSPEGEAFSLERELRQQGFNFGDMRLEQAELPIWETIYDTTFYQMAGGTSGLVHEGRYQLDWFDRTVAEFGGADRRHTAEELLRYYYAFLRGGTRPFGKHWGTAIYGQCEPEIAPLALTLAYDMGARYLWFWTSDHGHHVPWHEQLELTRTLRRHAAAHPRASIFGPPPTRDLVIAVPYGTFLSIEDWYGPREAEKIPPYTHLRHQLHRAIHEAFDSRQDFDITVDDGREITGYRRVMRLGNAD